MNHAFLIMAYNEPKLLRRIVYRMKAPNHFMFIHIDGKSDINEFKSILPEDDHTIYLEGTLRECVYWGGVSQIIAEIHLMNASFDYPIKMDYFHLISGQDYPCKTNSYIDNFFEKHKGESFLGFDDNQNEFAYKYRYRYFHFNDPVYCDNRILNILKFPIKCIQKFIPTRKQIFGIHKGANWFSLHRRVIGYCLNWCNEHPDFLNRMRYTVCMDECFIQTIVWDKMIELHITNNYLRYIDWSQPRSNGNSPAILDERDYDKIINSNAIFCRKVNAGDSQLLMNELDTYLSHKKR